MLAVLQPSSRLHCTPEVCTGSFSSDQPAPDALGMSASLRSRPNLRTAAIRREVPGGDLSRCSKGRLALEVEDQLNLRRPLLDG